MKSTGKRLAGLSASPPRLSRIVLAVAAVLLLLFVAVEAVGPEWLIEPSEWQDHSSVAVAIGSVLLLASDVLLPVPSSLVMVGNGAVFGWDAGTLLSTLGATISAVIGYALGRSASNWTATRVDSTSRARLVAFLDRFGAAAVFASRPIPIVAELVAILAGTGRMPWPRFLASAAAGSAIMGLAYSGAGDLLSEGSATVVVFAATAAVSGWLWWAGRRVVSSDADGEQ